MGFILKPTHDETKHSVNNSEIVGFLIFILGQKPVNSSLMNGKRRKTSNFEKHAQGPGLK